MVPTHNDKPDKEEAGQAGEGPTGGKAAKRRKAKRPKRWYERTSVTLCVAAMLALVALGFIHIITGVESDLVLPFDISRKSSFGYRETFVDGQKILALPYVVAKEKYPIGCRVLQDKGYMSSGRDFETRAVVRSWDNIKRWQEQFDRAQGGPESSGQEPWRNWPESDEADSAEARQYNQRGIELARTAQYAEAIAEFTRAIRKAPAQVEPYHNRALVHRAIGNLGQAADDFGKIAEIEPASAENHLRQGRLHMTTRQYAEAIDDFTHVIEIDPRCVEAYFKRALAYYAEGQYDRARDDANKLAGLDVSIPSGFLASLDQALTR